MSAYGSDTGVTPYEPPRQSLRGQLVDSVIILLMLFAVLFGVTYYVQSTADGAESATTPLAELPITPVERQQYQKLIDEEVVDIEGVNAQVAANHPRDDKYDFGIGKAILTFVVIAIYLAFVYLVSFKEYREVIRERFGPPVPAPTSTPEVDR
jgi:hypothetical protein